MALDTEIGEYDSVRDVLLSYLENSLIQPLPSTETPPDSMFSLNPPGIYAIKQVLA